jgi:hypothetical protein
VLLQAKIAQIDPKTRKKKEQVASDYLRAREPLLKRRWATFRPLETHV